MCSWTSGNWWAGTGLPGRLEEGIRGSASGVLVVSPHALSRPWVREEYEALLLQAVQDPARRLIPVLYADAELPPFLANRLWVDFRGTGTTGPVYQARLEELVRSLQGRPAADRPARDGAVQWPAAPGGQGFRAAGPLPAALTLSTEEVSLAAGEDRVAQRPRGLQRSTAGAVRDLVWRWAHPDPGAARVRGMRRWPRRGSGWARISWPGRPGRRWPPGSPRPGGWARCWSWA